MNLGVFLSIGESFQDYRQKGQYDLIVDYLLANYSRNFEKVFVFSYENEEFVLFDNVFVLPNKWRINRFLYSAIIPILYWQKIVTCSVLRGLQLTGGIPCFMAKALFKKSYVMNYGYAYDQFAQLEGRWLHAVLYRIIRQLILPHAHTVIITANYLRQHIEKLCRNNSIVLIPNGVDVNQFVARKERKSIDVLFIGRLEAQKNLASLIRAVSLSGEKLKTVIVGTGSQRKHLEMEAERLVVQCEFRGSVQHAKLVEIFNQSKIFVLPSLIEGNPKVLLEAFACGLPVIASNIDAHRDIVSNGQNGILCQPDAQSIAHALRKLIQSPKLQVQLGANARNCAVLHFAKTALNKKEIMVLKKAASV